MMIVCGLFEMETNLCRFLYHLFIYAIKILLTSLTPPHFSACPTSCRCPPFFLLRELMWEEIVCFVDIGEIVDHHGLIWKPSTCIDLFVFRCWKVIVHFFLSEVIGRFVDIGGIVDHHCLNFLFIMTLELKKNPPSKSEIIIKKKNWKFMWFSKNETAISTLILFICFVRTATSNRTHCYGKFLYKFNINLEKKITTADFLWGHLLLLKFKVSHTTLNIIYKIPGFFQEFCQFSRVISEKAWQFSWL